MASAFVRDRAVALLGLDPRRVEVIHHGIDHAVFSRRPTVSRASRSSSTPRARGRTRTTRGSSRRSRCSGASGRSCGSCSRAAATSAAVPEGVEVRGHVAHEELGALIRRAAALVFPSLYEGFGQPPLEAMACGCPVACSDAASLPEVCGDAARYFHPDDPRQIADAVLDVLDASEEWSRRGLERARGFTWDARSRRTSVSTARSARARRRRRAARRRLRSSSPRRGRRGVRGAAAARSSAASRSARPGQSPGSKSVPAPPSTSGIAPDAAARTGTPAASASASTIPNCSSQNAVGRLASTTAEARCVDARHLVVGNRLAPLDEIGDAEVGGDAA